MQASLDREYWRGKRVLLTGHTGFKGAWTTLLLSQLGAEVFGVALAPDTTPSLFDLFGDGGGQTSTIADIRDPTALRAACEWGPRIVIHMAAQPLVRRSYAEPIETFDVNLMGTVNLLEALRGVEDLEAVLVVTTDKVYRNEDTGRAFLEDDPLGGHDPYSASKAAAEMAVYSYAHSFFEPRGVPVATARAGNVIGGGDWSADRIVPDIWRAAQAKTPLELRMPKAVRPWQHVIEPLTGYLIYCQNLARSADRTPRALNFGPPPSDILTVAEVAERVMDGLGSTVGWRLAEGPAPREMKLLSLDPEAAARALGWRTRLDAKAALDWTSEWYRAFDDRRDMKRFTVDQIASYIATDGVAG